MPLTDTKVRNVKAGEKAQKLFDGGGLYLLVTPQGGKSWRLKYRFEGKEKLLAFGTYPEVSLSDARLKREEARQLLSRIIDPGAVRKAEKQAGADRAANSFEAITREWLAKYAPTWSPGHVVNITCRMERDVFPWIGEKPIAEIKAPELLAVLRRVESRGLLSTAHRIQGYCGLVFRYAVATGRAERDPTADLRGALPPSAKSHYAAIIDPKELVGLLRALKNYKGSPIVKGAMLFGAYTAVRPGELRQAEWEEIDFEAEQWNIPAGKMKMKLSHIVPLSRQALAALEEIRPLTGNGRYVFPNMRSAARPMSDNAIMAALAVMGYRDQHSGHGWRATFRTIGDEVLQFRPDFIEHQLAHAVKDPNGRAYNRTSFLDDRRKMMQSWADYLDGLKSGAKVIPINKAA